jgi:lauroyl/myristoyl acyltransferase
MTGKPGDVATPPEREPRPGLRGSAIMAAAWVAGHLPEQPLVAAADAAGELWYRTAALKRRQARANLQRVCEGLAASGRGPARARRAATDADALERLVRASFRHAARYYLEVLRSGAFDLDAALARIDIESPDEVRDAFQGGRPVVITGMHYGAIELPVILLSNLVGHSVTAPMETVADPGLAHWFRTSRSRVGVTVVSISDARRALLKALRRGESVGLVADRDLTHNGILVPFFGHPTPIGAGPALLALETGVPIYAASARRIRGGRYAARVLLVPAPTGGSRRERVTAYTASIARTFESILADGPEQWWGAFHPIWPDLAVREDEPADPNRSGGPGEAG